MFKATESQRQSWSEMMKSCARTVPLFQAETCFCPDACPQPARPEERTGFPLLNVRGRWGRPGQLPPHLHHKCPSTRGSFALIALFSPWPREQPEEGRAPSGTCCFGELLLGLFNTASPPAPKSTLLADRRQVKYPRDHVRACGSFRVSPFWLI